MKKQVISFLALFGLVFVLSIYYVLLPTNLFIKDNKINGNLAEVGMSIDETSNLYFATLNTKLNEKHENNIYNLESIVASSSQEHDTKEKALNSINSEYDVMNSELQICSLIKDQGYANVYVEYQEDIIKVIVQSEEPNNEAVASIMSIVMDNTINDLLPEIEIVS